MRHARHQAAQRGQFFLAHQFRLRFLQLAQGAVQGRVLFFQRFLGAAHGAVSLDARHRHGHVAGHEGQHVQFRLAIHDGLVIALHDDHAIFPVAQQHRRAHPAGDAGIAQRLFHLAAGHQRRIALRIEQAGLAARQHIRTHADAVVKAFHGRLRILFIDKVRNRDVLVVAVVQGNEEIFRRHQFADDGVQARVQGRRIGHLRRQVGDFIQRMLQVFRAAPLGHLVGQQGRALLYRLFQPVHALHALQRARHMRGDQREQGLVFQAETVLRVVALDDDGAQHLVLLVQQRAADPVLGRRAAAPGPAADGAHGVVVGRHHQLLAVDDDPGRGRLRGTGQAHAHAGLGRSVEFIDKIRKTHQTVVAVAQRHIKIGRIHDATQRRVHGLQEFADIAAGTGALADFQQHGLHGFQAAETTFHGLKATFREICSENQYYQFSPALARLKKQNLALRHGNTRHTSICHLGDTVAD
ncbi:hypothetical protein D3C81_599380 [compost metagenome]